MIAKGKPQLYKSEYETNNTIETAPFTPKIDSKVTFTSQ